MPNSIFIKAVNDSEYQWFANGSVLGNGSLEQLQADITSNSRLWLLLPGDKVLLNQLPCTAKERRHLRKAAPYELEEQLAGDVEQLHFAFTSPINDKVTAACCDREWLSEQLDEFRAQGLELHYMVPESLLLPLLGVENSAGEQSNGWVIRTIDDEIQVRYGLTQGFSIALPLAAMALQQLLSEQGEPEQILLLGDSDDDIDELQNLLPQSLHQYCESRLESWPQTLSAAAGSRPVLDMRQGDFSNHLPVKSWCLQWQKVAILATIVLAVFVTAQLVQHGQVKQQGQQLRKQIAETVTSALSRKAIGDTRRQLNTLRGELKKYTGNGAANGVSASALLAEVMPVFASVDSFKSSSIRFTGKSGELRVNCWAPSFDALQQIQTKLNKLGFDARMDASADGDGQAGTFYIQQHSQQRQR